ncbi:hypothetical protein HPB49_026411 [Dermacentor silvarum]|nr:hypothetical protein HPB49_026411 [Dermacentor silvarum]
MQNLTVSPIRFLARKHLYYQMLKEERETSRALLSAAVIGALKYLKYQARHTLDIEFASAGPTIHFLEAMQKWFTLTDVSNCQQYIHCNNDDCRSFSDVDDPRLDWLEHAFVAYIEDLRDASRTELLQQRNVSRSDIHNTIKLASVIC